ncbi:MAG TPA: hypothetical protein PKA13_23335 [Geminicoccaceae bacterium]|nr:hypothetical protein [Geminicoccus sp.]HMU52730.1 hypothetical protein [Geminicoccaceae bacterium]
MRTWLAILPPLWLAACTGGGMSEKPITADEMPVVFAPQEVMDGEPKYDRVYNGRTGADYRRMTVGSRRAFAEMLYLSTVGDYVFRGAALQQSVRQMIKEDLEITWGDSGTTSRGAVETRWQAFELNADGVRMGCMALRRELKHHAEVGNVPDTAQAIALGYLCRQGPAMTEGDAVRIAAVLRENV